MKTQTSTLLLALLLHSGQTLAGVTTSVINTNDSGPGSLRQAISTAISGSPITFAPSLDGQTNILTSGEILIDKNLSINASTLPNGFTISGNNASRIFNISTNSTTLSSLTIRDGRANNGGGIYNQGSLTLIRCSIISNRAHPGANGLFPGEDGQPGGDGGGIYNKSTLILDHCTLYDNRAGDGGMGAEGEMELEDPFDLSGPPLIPAGDGGNGGNGGKGGAIYSDLADTSLNACTLSANYAGNGGQGGVGSLGIFGPSGLDGIPGNGGDAGGLYSPTVNVNNTLFAQNVAGLGAPPSGNHSIIPDVFGQINSFGHNLISDPQGSSGWDALQDIIGTSPTGINAQLAPIADNGGPTPTMALLPTSPALETGDDTLSGTDQRGQTRLQGLHTDIGAYEFNFTGAPLPTSDTPITNAILHADINPNGYPTIAYIQYGSTTNYGSSTTPIQIPATTNLTNIALPLSGLPPGSTIHYRLVTQNGAGTTLGQDRTITTASLFPAGDANADGTVDQNEVDAVLLSSGTQGLALNALTIQKQGANVHLTLGLQKTDTLLTPPWNPLTNFTTTVNATTGKIQLDITAPTNTQYYRLFAEPTAP